MHIIQAVHIILNNKNLLCHRSNKRWGSIANYYCFVMEIAVLA